MDNRERTARKICHNLSASGHRALFAGGCVRDMILGRPPKDYDIATSASTAEIQALFPKNVDVGAAFGVVMVLTPAGPFEVASFRQDGPYLDGRHPSYVTKSDEKGDALRRDFTINAMFFDPERNDMLDYVGGQQDIQHRIIRTVGNPTTRFAEDYLRLFRAVRFAARLNYEIEPQTFAAIKASAEKILHTSAERLRDELIKLLTEGAPKRGLELLDQSALLQYVLPEVSAMKGVAQPPEFHPEGDVFVHTLLVLEKLQSADPVLAMGALLHDVGKPRTQTFDDRIRFNEHEKVGAQMAEAICRRLKFSNEDSERIVWLVAQHMRLAWTPEMREAKRKRFVREPGFSELIQLCRADCLGSHGDTSTVEWVEEYAAALKPEEARPVPLITGHDLINERFNPGPLFKEILSAVEDEQLEGRLQSREDAIAWVREKYGVPS